MFRGDNIHRRYPNGAVPEPDSTDTVPFTVCDLGVATSDQIGLFRELLEVPGLWIYLHGSQADGTTTAFSDFDDLVVVDSVAVRDADVAVALRRGLRLAELRFQRLDPLQHHGHWIVMRDAFDCYDAGYLPPWALRDALVVRGPASFTVRIAQGRTRATLEANVRSAAMAIEALYQLYGRGRMNLYHLKRLVGQFALFPAYLLQWSGDWVDKPEALARAAELYDELALECIRWSTRCRAEWARVLKSPAFTCYRAASLACPSPPLYRRLAGRFGAPVDVARLGMGGLSERSVAAFLEQSREFAGVDS
jgi:predicted nucleotidyltransferase